MILIISYYLYKEVHKQKNKSVASVGASNEVDHFFQMNAV